MEESYSKEILNYFKENYMPELDENEDHGFFFFDRRYYKVNEISKKGRNFFDALEEKMNYL